MKQRHGDSESQGGEAERLQALGDAFETMHGSRVPGAPLNKIIGYLRRGDLEGARASCRNELFDKITDETEQRMIIKKLFDGSGSPWKNLEEKIKKEQ